MYGVDCVIDVGAHEGEYAERLRAGGYEGEIVSFEPVPRAFAELERKAAADDGWSAHRLALGREDGTTTMNVVPGTLSSILPATKFGAGRYPRLQEPEEIEVEVRRLDGVLDETPRRPGRPPPVPEARHAGLRPRRLRRARATRSRASSACSPSSR